MTVAREKCSPSSGVSRVHIQVLQDLPGVCGVRVHFNETSRPPFHLSHAMHSKECEAEGPHTDGALVICFERDFGITTPPSRWATRSSAKVHCGVFVKSDSLFFA